MTRLLATGAALLFLTALGACGDDDGGDAEPQEPTESPTVKLRGVKFNPDRVTIVAGDTVTWVWDDGSVAHDIEGDGFSAELATEGEFEHTFDDPGTYEYRCTVHPPMTGEVIVVEE
jgi:plastocyanin